MTDIWTVLWLEMDPYTVIKSRNKMKLNNHYV